MIDASDRPLATGPFFLRTDGGERFCFVDAPRGPVRGAVLAVHAFAEEQNKTRAAVAEAARAIARDGLAVLRIDLFGCGDSAGDFGDASWDAWLADLRAAWHWLCPRAGGTRWLWGTRLGALLAARFAREAAPAVDGLLLWQPVVNGAQHLNQFIRLKTVGGLLRDAGATAGSGPTPREALAAGRSVEVAGYRLAPALVRDVDAASLGAKDATPPRVRWLEVVARDATDTRAAATPVATRLVDAWRAGGRDASIAVVQGPPFWQTAEVERAPALVDATVAALAR